MRQTEFPALEPPVQRAIHRGHDPAVAQLRFRLQRNSAEVACGPLDLDALAVLEISAEDSGQKLKSLPAFHVEHPPRLHEKPGLLMRLVGAGMEIVLPEGIGLA